ncbi:MAG: methionine--tRNA ligase [Planctomycetota bacterium]|jgi:methionyl-tRNA synthetase
MSTFYVTTPIYYVNDAPHVGHVYTTLLGDVVARASRLRGHDVFFLTGTDEHSERVVEAAVERDLSPRQWADRNAQAFREAFDEFGFSHSDFVRTSEPTHKAKVQEYISELQSRGAIVKGEYEGWWDHSQEEYVTETVAREHEFKSPVTGKDLVKRTEQNYFFRLSEYSDRLLAHIEANPGFIRPEARKNEVLGRIKQGLQDVPVSRRSAGEDPGGEVWGIEMPGDPEHRVYVWIDALFNYLSYVDTPERERYWPAQVHTMAKDILWFHAVIWPCMLMALDKPLPGCVYAHSYWIREGRKMSKSLGNFLDMPTLRGYAQEYSRDAVKWYLTTQGPMGATDADFAHGKFVEVCNADLANSIGNASSRVSNMIAKYFDGACPDAGGVTSHAGRDWEALASEAVRRWADAMDRVSLGEACDAAMSLSNAVDAYIHETAPFKLAKDESKMGEVGVILYHCVEALRIAAVLLSPVLPDSMPELLERFGQSIGEGDPFEALTSWGVLKPGTMIEKGTALFPRIDADAPEPGAVGA